MQKLAEIEPGPDHEVDVGIDVLKALPFVHQIGVHCDIKPGNVMKGLGPNGESKFFYLIDYGGMAIEPEGHGENAGYHRWTWTSKWTSQKRGEHLTYPVADLIELAYTMRTIQAKRRKEKNVDDSRSGFRGRVRKYYEAVAKMDRFPKAEDYVTLTKILKGKK